MNVKKIEVESGLKEPAHRDYAFLDVTSPKRPFELNSSNRMNCMGPSNGVNTSL
jgi:hypothetical protein